MADKVQRAYTLRLTGRDGSEEVGPDLLWKTHEAVNRGVRVFGDWLLTLRGGISHELADQPVHARKGDRMPTTEERRDRRILLALSWLTVEAGVGAALKYVVGRNGGAWATVEALGVILRKRGVQEAEVQEWVKDCGTTLSAAIADEAVWVNRSAAFDDRVAEVGPTLTRSEVWDVLGELLGAPASYLNMPRSEEDEADGGDAPVAATRQKELREPARQWLSSRFGSKGGADFERIVAVCQRMRECVADVNPPQPLDQFVVHLCDGLADFSPASPDVEGVCRLISGPGRKSGVMNVLRQVATDGEFTSESHSRLQRALDKEIETSSGKIGKKGRRVWSDAILRHVETACGFPYRAGRDHTNEYSVMLDHAARRVSALHSWVKLAEVRRRECEADASRRVAPDAAEWLQMFCASRTEWTGALEPYRIRRRAIGGWGGVVATWGEAICRTEQERIEAARELQGDAEVKFGDIQLFEELAAEDARVVWIGPGGPDASILENFVRASEARHKQLRFKVPAYRHPDPLQHPVFCDFGNSRWSVRFAAQKPGAEDLRQVQMGLYDGKEVSPVSLRWHSKRLPLDLALEQNGGAPGPVRVTRANRLGRVAGGATSKDVVEILALAEEEWWNGRLQAPRRQLAEIDRLAREDGLTAAERAKRVEQARAKIRWSLTFSARLQPQGPWLDYAKLHGLRTGWPHTEENRRRAGRARLVLCRLPGLRILSVDLGHRYAAACAVLETVTQEDVDAACRLAGVELDPGALHVRVKTDRGTVMYRRIGDSAWARLERSFVIRLPGEQEDIRKASPGELAAVLDLEGQLGSGEPEWRPKEVAGLVGYTLWLMRRALGRHARRAGIAIGLAARDRVMPGARVQPLAEEERAQCVAEALVEWYGLVVGTRWRDVRAEELWSKHIQPLLAGAELPADLEGASFRERKQQGERLMAALLPVAQQLSDESRGQMVEEWRADWLREEARWRRRLRWVKDWILPGGCRGSSPGIRHTGGLSLARIENLRALYRLQKAHAGRIRVEAGGERASRRDLDETFGQRALDALTRLRDNRVKQTASRIAASALGLGDDLVTRKGAPCHAVVVENLGNYRPDEVRTRRENRQLMSWCAARVRDYLSQLCELYGMTFREVPAAYTSRQDSLTGAPGVRAEDVPVSDLLKAMGFWERELRAAHKQVESGNARARIVYLVHVHEAVCCLSEELRKQLRFVRIPIDGGPVFVSSDPASSSASGTQADINAAGNIGLRALMDPDWSGAWWYVPCQPKALKPVTDAVKGSVVFDGTPLPATPATAKQAAERDRPVNLWRDVSGAAVPDAQWQVYADYREQTMERVCAILQRQLANRLAGLGEDLPF